MVSTMLLPGRNQSIKQSPLDISHPESDIIPDGLVDSDTLKITVLSLWE